MDTNNLKAAAKQVPAAVDKAQSQLKPTERVKLMLTKRTTEIANALPKGWDTTRFIRIAMTAVSSNPKLQEACCASPMSFISAMMNAAQLGLEPNTSLQKAYLLPYNNIDKNTGKKVPMVQFQIGVYGYMDLAFRSGLVKSISAEVRYKKDFWEYEKGTSEKLRHIPYDEGDPGEAVGYYAVIHLKDSVNADGTKSEGAVITKYMPRFRVLEHAKRFSKSYNRKAGTFSGPWETDFDAMALKTVLLQALKYCPKASEDATFAKAFTMDATVRNSLDSDSDVIKTEGVFADSNDDNTIETEFSEIEPRTNESSAE